MGGHGAVARIEAPKATREVNVERGVPSPLGEGSRKRTHPLPRKNCWFKWCSHCQNHFGNAVRSVRRRSRWKRSLLLVTNRKSHTPFRISATALTSSWLFLYTIVFMEQHRHTSSTISAVRPILRPGDVYALLRFRH